MRVIVTEAPAPVVTWDQANAHLALGGDETQRPYVESLIAAATANIDGPTGWLGRCIGMQTLEVRFDVFRDAMCLPYGPVAGIVAVTYLNGTGAVETVPKADYEVRGWLIGSAFGRRWPAAAPQPEAVRIAYRAGYETVPAPVRAAILLMVGDLFRFRETAGAAASKVPMSTTVENLLAPLRVFA